MGVNRSGGLAGQRLAMEEADPGMFRSMVEQCASGIVIQCEERIQYANRATLDCLGWRSLDEVVDLDLATFLHADSYAILGPSLRKLAPDDDQLFMGELKLRRRDGMLLDAEVYHVAMPDTQDGTSMLTFRDVTQLKRIEAELAATWRKLEEKDALLTADLTEAQTFQQRILPTNLAVPGVDMEVIYRPLGLVGGDLYDFHVMEDGRLRLFVADATGHGVQAALATMVIKSEYESAKRAQSDAEVLAGLNDRVAARYRDCKMLFTAVSATVDLAKGVLSCAVGGHPPPLVRSGSGVSAQWRELEGAGAFLGWMPAVTFADVTTPFAPGDALHLFSDGAIEQTNTAHEQFGYDRLVAALDAAAREGRSAAAELRRRLDAFSGSAPTDDDFTYVALHWLG